MPNTPEIIAAQSGPINVGRMKTTNPPVSSRSNWNSKKWVLDLEKVGKSRLGIDFSLVPARFSEAARVAAWSALVDPRSTIQPAITTVINKMARMDEVLAWIARCNTDLSEVDEDLFECFLDDLETVADEGGLDSVRSDKPTMPTVLRMLQPWGLLRDQAQSMRDSGLDALSFDPFAEEPMESIAAGLSGDRKRKTPPLPDEISVPLVDAAARLAGTATDEIAEAVENFVAAQVECSGSGLPRGNLKPLAFSPLENEGAPWLKIEDSNDWLAHQRVMWRGVRRVVGAHVMMVFACGVPRPSELLSAPSGMDVATGLPACVERTTSASQLFDHYWMLATREKHTDGEPEDDDWFIGCAVAGDEQPPEAVEALLGIQRILEPIRRLGDAEASTRLLVTFGSGFLSVEKTDRIRPMAYNVMRNWMQEFITQAIDWDALPDTARDGRDLTVYKRSRGLAVTPRAWRKTLVQFMLRIDGRMTLPLARRLRHKIHSIVNEAYQDSDPALLEEVDDAMARTLARTLVGVASGERRISGWLGERMAAHLDEIRTLTEGLTGEPAIVVVQRWARERQLGLLEAGPGKCGLRLMPKHALCHQVAGTAGWWQREPHPNRCDEHCANCKCCIVDSDHIHFWTSRYVETRRQVLISRRLRREGEAWAHAAQAEIAKTMLTRLEARIPPDEEIEG